MTKDPSKFQKRDPYASRMRKITSITPEEIAKLSPKKFAIYQNAMSWLHAHEEKTRAEAAARAQTATKPKAAHVAAARDNAAPQMPKISAGKIALYALNPFDFGQSFRGLQYLLAMLVQIFARILISVGLIAPDHPARRPGGALGYRLFALLEEARVNLLPVKVFLEKSTAKGLSDIRVIAARQYMVFSAIVGLFATGLLTVLMEISRWVFGAAYAFAATETTGISMGGCPLIASGSSVAAVPDYASACLDGIFGTAPNSAASVAQSGLGTMLSAYSSMMLVFAGIIVLWIIISAVAETARSGIPFGKGFNHIWAPIRLIVALGLLVPIGFGLNSGQYIVVSLAKWGSQQATQIWNAYAAQMIGTSGLASVSYDTASNQNFVATNFEIALCSAIQNAACGSGTNCQITQTPYLPNVAQTGAVVQAAAPPPGTNPLVNPAITEIKWHVPGSNTAPAPNGISIPGDAASYPVCGDLTIKTSPSNPSSQPPIPGTAAAFAQTAQTTIMTQQNYNDKQLVSILQPIAQEVVSDTQTMGQSSLAPLSPSQTNQIIAEYSAASQAYQSAQTSTISGALQIYNNSLQSSQVAAQQGGWLYAPVWLMNIVNANALISDATHNIATASGPVANPPSSDGTLFPNDPTAEKQWELAQQIVAQASSANVVAPTSADTTGTNILNTLTNLTNTTTKNPLAAAGVYGRDMMVTGFFLIQPQNIQDCFLTGGTFAPGGVCKQIKTAIPTNMQGVSGLPTTDISGNNNPLINQSNNNQEMHGMLYPIGMVMISMGFLLVMLTFIPFSRFILGVLNWIVGIFEAILAIPLVSLSLLATGGEGFATQQFTADIWLLTGTILRPILMAIGVVISITAFNDIMQITNLLFGPNIQSMPLTSDNSYLSLGIYVAIYGSLAYTLANSSFKLIDMMPNWVMNWIGARMESRVDDASVIQQQASGYVSTMAYARDGSIGRTAAGQQRQTEAAAQVQAYTTLNEGKAPSQAMIAEAEAGKDILSGGGSSVGGSGGGKPATGEASGSGTTAPVPPSKKV